jgi:hypothetical protein
MALARWQAAITDDAGNVQDGAAIEVRRETAGAPLAAIFSDRDGAVPLGNPFLAGPDGYAAFHAAGGAYRITASKGAFSRVWRYAAIGTAAETDAAIGAVTAPAALPANALIAGADDLQAVKAYSGEELPPGNDLNNLEQTGVAAAEAGIANRPVDAAFLVLTLRRALGFLTQLAHGRDTNQLYARQANGGVWGSWRRLLKEDDVASSADLRAAAAATPTDAQILTAPLIGSAAAPVALTDAATIAVDWGGFINGAVTLAGNRTLGNPAGGQPGTWRTIELIQDGAGNRALSYGSAYVHPGGAATPLSTAAGARDRIAIFCADAARFEVYPGGRGFA